MADRSVQPSVVSRKPSNSAIKQQRLPAWQPILSVETVLPTFFIIGIVFIPIGIGLLLSSNNVKEFVYDYTDCVSDNKGHEGQTCADVLQKNATQDCNCSLPVSLSENFDGDVYIYYGLDNFHQNHRRYVSSRDDSQLWGAVGTGVSRKCGPFDRSLADANTSRPVIPCGAIANSLFNDTLTLRRLGDGFDVVPVLKTGIAWPSDKSRKFNNPQGDLQMVYQNFTKPPNWHKNIWELDEENADNNGLQNEDLIVWMRTAAFPNFRKLYRRLDRTKGGYTSGLPSGNYTLHVVYNFPVKSFAGGKRVVISTTWLLGSKNAFLGISYIVVGCVVVLLSIVLLVVHNKYGRSIAEMTDVTPTCRIMLMF